MAHALQKLDELKTISYGDPRAHLLLWQKSVLLVPIWGVLAIPIFGLVVHTISKSAVQVGFGLMLSFFLVYFVNDVLKRKITFDNNFLYFGFETMPIKDLVSIEVLYKRNKFLPAKLVLNSISGQKMKFGLNGLTDKDVDTLVKHLQTNNSNLETANALASLVKCRRARVKPLETPQWLELPVNSREALVQAVDTYRSSAGKWMRLGPIISLGFCIPVWVGVISSLYVCLQPRSGWLIQQLNDRSLMARASSAFLTSVANVYTNVYAMSKPFIQHPLLLAAELLFFVLLFLAVQRLVFQANSLVADSRGIKLLFRCGFFSIPVKRLNWSDISCLTLYRHHDEQARLQFVKSNGKKVDLRLDSLSLEHRAVLLKRVEKAAPSCQIDEGLAEIMLPKANQSYTEIWLQSLSQSPERATLDPLGAGQLVGAERFEVLRKIGVGGQGTAYLCKDLHQQVETLVVLKETIIPVFANNATTLRELERFEREAKILHDLKYPGVVSLIQYFVEDHRAYLVLEHVDGMSLLELVKRDGVLAQSQVIELAAQMAEILSFLHSHGVIHRDFTPDNLLLNSQGRLKLIDFNVAQKGGSGLTGTIVGKHAYLPPEQFRGKATDKSDIYAFGATLFFLLTGTEPEPISQSCPLDANAEVSPALNDIVKKATTLKEENRFSGIDEMKLALIEVVQSG
ncbi:MAG: serine/threonine-protein kinase [Candidatus Obscuribacterales bacterium]|nr:serine/threonine-protein kinase [Candidatus Obscuribacterales bacterium]